MISHFFGKSVFSGCLLLLLPLTVVAQNDADAKQALRRNALRLINQPDGLHKAALANGGKIEVGGQSPSIDRVAGLPDLVDKSSLIAVVKVTGSKTLLVENGTDLETIYTLNLVEGIKGLSAQRLSVAVPGGAYTFSDGSVATETEDLCRPYRVGGEYLIFLIESLDRPGRALYYPTSRCQATFEVTPDGTHMSSHTYLVDDQLRNEAKLGKRALIQKVKGLMASKEHGQ